MPRLIILLSTYPLPSFDGKTPSANRNELARKWSAITLKLELLFLSTFTFNEFDADSINFLTDTSQFFVVSGGLRLLANSSGSIVLTQITGGRAGNNKITTTNPSASVTGFRAGTDNQSLWDLRLLQSSDGISSSFEFRLNNSETGSNIITCSAISMSTNHTQMRDGQLWNVMLQRMTSSTTGVGTNEYRLHTTLQEKERIKIYNYITMSVSGALVGDSTVGGKGFFANQNW